MPWSGGPASARLLLPDEETLRDWLMFLLSTNYEAPNGSELFVGGETVNGKGKTDILIHHQGPERVHRGMQVLAWAEEVRRGDRPAARLHRLARYQGSHHLVHYESERHRRDRQRGRMPASHPQSRTGEDTRRPRWGRHYVFASPHDAQRTISLSLLPVVIPGAS